MVARPGGRVGAWGSAPPTGRATPNQREGQIATTTTPTDRTAALDEIQVANNVRALDADHLRALARSIRLKGMPVPVVERPAEGDVALGGWTFELVAGLHRVAAAADATRFFLTLQIEDRHPQVSRAAD